MSNSIIEMLNLVDDDLSVCDQSTHNGTLSITVEKTSIMHICPVCGSTMHSKGVYKRKLNHPIFQDGRNVQIILKRRKYKCCNPKCGYMSSDTFNFVQPYKHSTNILPLLILKEFKSLNISTKEVAERLHVSDTLIHDTFMNTVRLDRLPLSSIISIDEVYMNIDYLHKYSLVIFDFITGDVIDIVKSRRQEETEPYFLAIPLEERMKVEYLVCDMYKPYINYIKQYFPNAKAVVDCFHVIKWINDRLTTYLRGVKKRYQDRDKAALNESNYLTNKEFKSKKKSREVYILSRYSYYLFSNKDNIDYLKEPRYDFILRQTLDAYQCERMFFSLDSKLSIYRDLKEIYIQFDKKAKLNPSKTELLLEDVISAYASCGETIFEEFSVILKRNKKYIINSYTTVKVQDSDGKIVAKRLSNGPIESFNYNPKHLKRVSRGIRNFDYARSRILWATRKNPRLIIPSKEDKYQKPQGRKRGPYKKKQ